MKHPLRSIAIWLVMIATGIAAFSLTLNITSDSMENANGGGGVVIDLNQDPYEAATTESNSSFWERHRRNQHTTTTEQPKEKSAAKTDDTGDVSDKENVAATESSNDIATEEGRMDE